MNFKFIFLGHWLPSNSLGSANSFQEMLESFEVRERMISEELKNNLENSSLYSSRGYEFVLGTLRAGTKRL